MAPDPEPVWVEIPAALPAVGQVVGFEAAGRSLLLWNVEGDPSVIQGECPHARVALAAGVLRGCVLECPLHGGKLDARDGSPVAPPIRVPAAVYPVRRVGDVYEVELPAARGPRPNGGGRRNSDSTPR